VNFLDTPSVYSCITGTNFSGSYCECSSLPTSCLGLRCYSRTKHYLIPTHLSPAGQVVSRTYPLVDRPVSPRSGDEVQRRRVLGARIDRWWAVKLIPTGVVGLKVRTVSDYLDSHNVDVTSNVYKTFRFGELESALKAVRTKNPFRLRSYLTT
jgi:hypothetical protein